MPTVAELAAELGIDAASLKPEVVTKWNGYLTDADKKYTDSTALAAQAQANLTRVQEEQDAINKHIEQYGENESSNAALRANYAAMEAQLKTLKESGMNVNLPAALPAATTAKGPASFDADKFRGAVSSTIADITDLNNRHLLLTGQPMPDRSERIAEEARKAGKSLYDYGAQKYDFAGIELRKNQEKAAAHDAEVAAKAVKEFREKNPNMTGNPDAMAGAESRFGSIAGPRKTVDIGKFANMSPREKIAASVRASREAIQQQAS